MINRVSNTQLLSFFTDLKKFGRLNLEPIWQRKPGVWTLDYKRYFIDSILRNYPFPTILLNARTSADGTTIYEVVDGKQRLTAIFEFLNDEFTTSREYSDDLGAPQIFSDMPSEAKKSFYEYQLTVEVISDGSLEELRQAFDRLNRNVARLNSQELRHAQFSGRFIQLMERLADDEFWSEIGVATPARTRRMLDVQFVSQVFILTMDGVQDGDESIDQLYADYDEDIPDERRHRRIYNACKTILQELQETHSLIRNSRYGNLADLYSLWAAVRDVVLDGNARRVDYDETARGLERFAEEVGSETPPEEAAKYLVAARQGSNKGPNRALRRDALRRRIVLKQ